MDYIGVAFSIIAAIGMLIGWVFDKFWWLILIILIMAWLRSNYYWFRDLEKVAEDYGEKLGSWTQKDKKFAESWPSSHHNKQAAESELQLKNFVKAHKHYLHLLERFKHDKIGSQVKKDWINYLRATKIRLDAQMDYSMDIPENRRKSVGREDYQATITLEEIDRKFDKYMAE